MKGNIYTGLSQTTTKATGTTLTEKTISGMVKYHKSKKAHKKWIEEEKARIGLTNSFAHQITCGDGTGGKITMHSVYCPEGLYREVNDIE
jgi:hypothetical protein